MSQFSRRQALLLGLTPLGCVGTTGGDLLELLAFAAGPRDATFGPLRFRSSRGYLVELAEARLWVGGLYLNRSRAASVASDTSCSLPGIYVAQVLGGLHVDLLSPEPQPFPSTGYATAERALTGELWLAEGDVNEPESEREVLHVSGTAERAGQRWPFAATLSIGQSRSVPSTDAALPGQHPVCKQRIVSPIPLDLLPAPGRALLLRADPRAMFGNVDFQTLSASDGVFQFADESGVDQASDNLYAGLRRSTGVYSLGLMESA